MIKELKEKWLMELGVSKEEFIKVPKGFYAVVISAYFDNSNLVSDYIDPYAKLSPNFVLGYIKGKVTEKKLREFVKEELEKYGWKFVDDIIYKGFNYLKSNTVGKVKHRACDGREEVSYWYQIEVCGSGSYLKSKWYRESSIKTFEESEEVMLREYLGKIYLSLLVDGGYEFEFGVREAKIILDNMDKIRKFVKGDYKGIKLGRYKGYPILVLEYRNKNKVKNFSFGLKKAKAILNNINKIREFVEIYG